MNKRKIENKGKKTPASSNKITVLSPDQLRAQGKALRDKVPRSTHAGWTSPADRHDPIDILIESNRGRVPELIPIRFGRMLESPFAFFRGSAAIMAADLVHTPVSGVFVQACGDAHLMNFGGVATPERQINFDINDFDETLPAPWEWDLKRLAASIVIAARHLELRKAQESSSSEVIFLKLAEFDGEQPRIKDNPPLIFHVVQETGEGFDHQAALATYRDSLPEHIRRLFDRFQLCDVAAKVVGVGSVGTRCLVSLFMAADNDPLFLQVKEARSSVLEPYAGKSQHANHGERIVAGQRLMQAATDIFLGWTLAQNGQHFYFRQLRDVKISAIIEGWDAELLSIYGTLCARVLARAHARSGDAGLIAGYMGSSQSFDESICEFAVEYADQVRRDYREFVKAVHQGRLEALRDPV